MTRESWQSESARVNESRRLSRHLALEKFLVCQRFRDFLRFDHLSSTVISAAVLILPVELGFPGNLPDTVITRPFLPPYLQTSDLAAIVLLKGALREQIAIVFIAIIIRSLSNRARCLFVWHCFSLRNSDHAFARLCIQNDTVIV
jgi:hypothetical protein